jgi:hypothetical protein
VWPRGPRVPVEKRVSEMAGDRKYVVLKLLTKIEVAGAGLNKSAEFQLGGCAGYLPVFDTEEEAQEVAGSKYQVIPIEET